MALVMKDLEGKAPAVGPTTEPLQASVTLGAYLAAVTTAVVAGLPQRTWVEATVAAVKPGPYGHALQLIDPGGGSSAPTMRAFLREADRNAISRRLGAPLDPAHLVGMTIVAQIEPEFHPRWGMGGRVVGLSTTLRESLLRRTLAEVRARLKAECLYDRQRRLELPPDIVRVAVIHPAGAAGYADIAGELTRWQHAGIVAVTSMAAAFEGPRAAAELVAALGRAATGDGVPPDIVMMVRGGGDRAGLLALDNETVARAVCLCPVPVIAGLGHQVDSALVDDVAAVSCHTPSKALPHLAGLIAGPARRARADITAVMIEAERRALAAVNGLAATRGTLLAAAERQLAGGAAALATVEAGVEAAAAGAAERCRRLADDAARQLQAVLERAPLRIGEVAREAERAAGDGMAGARRRLERADDGRALIGTVSSRAAARLDAAALDLQRRHQALPLDAARRLTDAGVDLAGLGRTVETLGLDSTLKRGFALATTLDGTLVPTRAAALAAGDVTLTFADGAVTARVGTILTTDQTGEAA